MDLLDRLRAWLGGGDDAQREPAAAPETSVADVDEGAAAAHDMGMVGQVASQGSPTGVPSLAERPMSEEAEEAEVAEPQPAEGGPGEDDL